MKRLLMPMSLLLLIVLAACAPAVDPGRVQISQLREKISFFPHETGAVWTYLPEGAQLDTLPVHKVVVGPTVRSGVTGVVSRMAGRGIDTSALKRYEDDGVYVYRVTGPGYITTLDPPIREYPSARELGVGASWSGETRATVVFTEAQGDRNTESYVSRYTYTVVDHRTVSVEEHTFDVFVINLESQRLDDSGEVVQSLHQEKWFAPYVGEVRTENGYLLVDANFPLGDESVDGQAAK